MKQGIAVPSEAFVRDQRQKRIIGSHQVRHSLPAELRLDHSESDCIQTGQDNFLIYRKVNRKTHMREDDDSSS